MGRMNDTETETDEPERNEYGMVVSDDDHPIIRHDIDHYPDWRALPDQREFIDKRDWDVLIVFDACRWDYLQDLVEGYEAPEGEVRQVKTPAEESTPDWTTKVWCRDDVDFTDVTYISANPFTTFAKGVSRFGGDIEANVGKYIKAFDPDNGFDHLLNCTRPDDVTEMALEEEPPMVVHYLQPHEPYIGNISAQASLMSTGNFVPEYDHDDEDPHEDPEKRGDPKRGGPSGLNRVYRDGQITGNYLRAAYKSDLKLVWDYSVPVMNEFDNVVVTADHGEVLGPERFDHGDEDDPRARMIPWYEV